MKLLSKKLCLALAGVSLVLAGCAKKPVRPDPSVTAMGPQNGSGTLNPTDLSTSSGLDNGLTPRPVDEFDKNNEIRGKLESVYFDFNASDIKAAERVKLQAAKKYLDENPTQRLLLEGHCDWRGTAEYNLALGDRRANAAKKFLVSLGVAADRLESNSKGSLDATKEGGEAAWAKDRRVELVIGKAKQATP